MKTNHRLPVLIWLLLLLNHLGNSQGLPPFEKTSFELLDVSSLQMADFNNDGLMDLVTVSAKPPHILKVYKNIENDNFSEVFEFPAFENSRLEIMDVNQDNNPDLFLVGNATQDSVAMLVLLAQENFSFSSVPVSADLKSLSVFLWLEYDDHILPDLLLSGISGTSGRDSVFILVQEEEGFKLSEAVLELGGLKNIEKIPHPDQLFYAETSEGPEAGSAIYKLSGGRFSAEETILPTLRNTVTAQGDLDHDGNWDLFLYGTDPSGRATGGVYSAIAKDMQFIPVDFGDFKPLQAQIIDLTNDGLADLVLMGKTGGKANTFVASASDNFKLRELPFSGDHMFLADYDKDGKPEVLTLSEHELVVYKKIDGKENAPPVAPVTLLGIPLKEGFFFTWTHGSDDKTPTNSLTYDLMLSVKGEDNVYRSSLINPKTGLDKSFGYGALGTYNIFEWKYPTNQPFSLMLTAFDHAHHTALPSCIFMEGGTGGISANSGCVNETGREFYVCETTTASLNDFLKFDAQYWVSFEKGYLGESGANFEMDGNDFIYGIKAEGNCIELFTAIIIFGSNKETASFELVACEGDSVELISPAPSHSYQWKDSGGGILGTEEGLWYTPEKSETIFLTRQPLSGACPATDTFNIIVYPYPELQVMEDVTLRAGEEVALRAWGAESYLWSPAEGLSDPANDGPMAGPLKTTTYYVTGQNEGGCEAKDSVTVTILQDFFVPSLFSPNFDGRNDRLSIFGSGIRNIEFRVYDQTGNLVFEANTPQQAQIGWDGTHKGRSLPTGNYTWQFKGSFEDGTPLQFQNKTSGFVTLIR